MNIVLTLLSSRLPHYKMEFYTALTPKLVAEGFEVMEFFDPKELYTMLKFNARVVAVLFDWDDHQLSLTKKVSKINPQLPVITLSNQHEPLDIGLSELNVNLEFLCYEFTTLQGNLNRILKKIEQYLDKIMPPFTRALFSFARANEYTFCTPGHLGGTAFQKSPVGTQFYDFYGENTFKADLSVSVSKLGSLLEHTGPHREAELLAAKIFNADKTFFVTNGTSTSNKIVGMYAAPVGSTVLVDRNCHKSITHLLMMRDVLPIYLKPTRNAFGILGGIPKKELSSDHIKKEIKKKGGQFAWPTYAIITNSTYDGLLYNVREIKKTLRVKHLHFDSAWVPYTNFHPIYKGKYGMDGQAIHGMTIYETQSSHKLLAAFSQASMIHIKGEYDLEIFNEGFMMHSSTSPQYGIVASCEIAAAMMGEGNGRRLMQAAIEEAFNFRLEIKRIKRLTKSWFFDVWQPAQTEKIECWPLLKGAAWHGFKNIDDDHLYLDPIKVTLLLPGIKNNRLEKEGIPAPLVAWFLDAKGIVVEKTGPYSLLFLFSFGIDRAKSMGLLKALVDFKKAYDENALVEDVLPALYEKSPAFYRHRRLQDIAQGIHALNLQYRLTDLMYEAYETLPDMKYTPYQAYQKMLKGEVRKLPLSQLLNRTSAVMILPYPPGVPLIMPGETVTPAARAVLDYLLLLQEIGKIFPGFESDIHGVTNNAEGEMEVLVCI